MTGKELENKFPCLFYDYYNTFSLWASKPLLSHPYYIQIILSFLCVEEANSSKSQHCIIVTLTQWQKTVSRGRTVVPGVRSVPPPVATRQVSSQFIKPILMSVQHNYDCTIQDHSTGTSHQPHPAVHLFYPIIKHGSYIQ